MSRLGPVSSLQNSANNQISHPALTQHLFADNVRFISMAAIVGIHTIQAYGAKLNASEFPEPLNFAIQFLKFGTIGFFLVAGFLFGERIDHFSPREYFLRRLRNVFLPWCFWVFLWCVVRTGADLLNGNISGLNSRYFFRVFMFYSRDGVYWFVPNLLIALALLLLLRPYLRDIRIGLLFFAISLFYGVNIYGHWITIAHSHAVFGFVFYLWLGAWGAWHFTELETRLARVPVFLILGAVALALGLAQAESAALTRLHSVDPVNTLRITNQICSVVTVLALLKLKTAVWPAFVHVREQTYGVYLIHTVVISFLVRLIGPIIQNLAAAPRWLQWAGSMLMLPAMFALVYGGALLAVRFLSGHEHLRWMAGLRSKEGAKSRLAASEAPKRLAALARDSHSAQLFGANKI